MSYSGKTNWQFDEVVKEADLNRIEQGLLDAHAGVETAKSEAKAYTDEKVDGITPGAIGAVKKSDFDAHTADAGLHVTAAKQAAWDAKETPAGAQAKADVALAAAKADATSKATQAETNAKNFTNSLPWQRVRVTDDLGFAINISNGNLNDDRPTGWYMGSVMANAPSSEWYYVEIIRHNNLWMTQTAFNFNNNYSYTRRKMNGTWGGWTNNLDSGQVRIMNGQLEFFNGSVWKAVGGKMSTFKGSNSIRKFNNDYVSIFNVQGSGVFNWLYYDYPNGGNVESRNTSIVVTLDGQYSVGMYSVWSSNNYLGITGGSDYNNRLHGLPFSNSLDISYRFSRDDEYLYGTVYYSYSLHI
ncbi:pyocin knob domain-containing protein [Paenibacillus aquistagni]|uniref:Uncharacterized protein n=1 Tax=Paenibacillus aquistagni TaxID=1852522 RepID=A0A1X7KAI5_9BACL|nr:pyocin knob domain-containing protein [Paenibacillus aquistagni]SMG38195.1 hypothetical protein SAMN06295960_2282 [Paenibacillus aquistagni]